MLEEGGQRARASDRRPSPFKRRTRFFLSITKRGTAWHRYPFKNHSEKRGSSILPPSKRQAPRGRSGAAGKKHRNPRVAGVNLKKASRTGYPRQDRDRIHASSHSDRKNGKKEGAEDKGAGDDLQGGKKLSEAGCRRQGKHRSTRGAKG